ncbi:MAG: helix-turn-helix domain-containing protein [Polyangiaceae bacterium]
MPRKTDPKLSARILTAAHGLWSSGGEEALTMRAVAVAAKTTTPTVYAHFVDRQGLLQALRKRAAAKLEESLKHTESFTDGCRRYLAFSEKHPNDYALLFGAGWRARAENGPESGPLTLLKNAIAESVGGSAENQLRLATSILLVLHGAANLIATGGGATAKKSTLPDLSKACIDACNAIVENARGPAKSDAAPKSRPARKAQA